MAFKIGYDARMIEHSGIGVRIQHILKYWPLSHGEAELHIFGDPAVLKKHSLPKKAKIVPYLTGIYSLKEFSGHPEMKNMDVLDIPHFNVPLRYLKKCIVTVHDLIPFHFKSAHGSLLKRIYLQITLRSIAKFAAQIITVSEYTKKDFQKHFLTESERIRVIYNGFSKDIFYKHTLGEVNSFRGDRKLPKEYLLTSGIGKAHKNFEFLLNSLTQLWSSKQLETPLVIAGISKEIPDFLKSAIETSPGKIFLLPHIPYEALPLAYQAAVLFVYPSLFEGFGFPVLEAQAVGTPVLSSEATVLPEILEDSALYFDPANSSDFESKLLTVLKNQTELARLSKLGKKNSERFLWKDQIQKLGDFYRKEILNS